MEQEKETPKLLRKCSVLNSYGHKCSAHLIKLFRVRVKEMETTKVIIKNIFNIFDAL